MTRRRAGFAALLLLASGPFPLAAQEASAERHPGVRAFAEAGLAVSRIHGDLVPVVELGAGLSLASGVSLGGAARLLPAPVAVGRIVLREVELDLGYGGLVVHLNRPGWSERSIWTARLLVGAGNADVLERSTSLRLDSDNFFVLEPSLGLDAALVGRLRAGASLSYRFVSGVEDLRGVAASHLRAPSLSVHLGIWPL